MAENKDIQSLPEVRAAVAALSPEDKELLAAVQASPFKLTTPEQFKEFTANTDYFVFESNVRDLNDLGLRFIAQHTDILLTPELLSAIDPIPFGQYAAKEEQGHFLGIPGRVFRRLFMLPFVAGKRDIPVCRKISLFLFGGILPKGDGINGT